MNTGEEQKQSINNESKHVGGHRAVKAIVKSEILNNNSLCLLSIYICAGLIWFGLRESFSYTAAADMLSNICLSWCQCVISHSGLVIVRSALFHLIFNFDSH